MKNGRLWVPIVLSLLGAFGCDSHEDLRVRFEMERQLWRAERYRQGARIDHRMATHPACNAAIATYEAILRRHPADETANRGGRPQRVRDTRLLALQVRIALSELYFLIHRSLAGGVYLQNCLDDFEMADDALAHVQLDLSRKLYEGVEYDSLEMRLVALFDRVVEDDLYWVESDHVSEEFLSIPLHIARVRWEWADSEGFEHFCTRADDFYTRVLERQHGSPWAREARVLKVRLNILRGHYGVALDDVVAALESPQGGVDRTAYLLVKSQVLSAGLGRHEEAAAVLDEVISASEDGAVTHTAMLRCANVYLKRHQYDRAFKILEELETKDSASDDIRSRAMFVRAIHLQRQGYWTEALHLLRRITRFYPHTKAAVEAPLVIGRHYVAQGDSVAARRNLEKAREFYVGLLGQASILVRYKLIIEDFLVESFLLMGRPREAALLLEQESGRWTEATRAAGYFKSGLLYLNVLDDPGNARKILKKCIELFPETRYSRVAQELLIRMDSHTDNSG